MERELNNRAIWYPKTDEDKQRDDYKHSMFYHLTEGAFKPFVDLVKKSEVDESIPTLMLCFRSNKQSVTIYYNNHIIWNLSISDKKPKVTINPNHARYSKDWIDKLSLIGFDKAELKNKERLLKEEGKIIHFQYKTFTLSKLPSDFAEKSLPTLLKMIDDSFDTELGFDYFQNRPAYKGYSRKTGEYKEGKRDLVEKKRQQEYYIEKNKFCDGYFVYDMEYEHEYGKEDAKETDFSYMGVKKANQTDCLAIKYDNHGKPQKLAFVEIKSVKESMTDNKTDGSGLKAHMINMDKYITMHLDYMKLRIKEAKDILNLYYLLGLRGVSKDICEADYSQLELFGNQEVVLVYTDSARKYIETAAGETWKEGVLKPFPTVDGAYEIFNLKQ